MNFIYSIYHFLKFPLNIEKISKKNGDTYSGVHCQYLFKCPRVPRLIDMVHDDPHSYENHKDDNENRLCICHSNLPEEVLTRHSEDIIADITNGGTY